MDKLAKFQLRQNFRVITPQNFKIQELENSGNLEIWENWQNLRKGLENLAKHQFIHVIIEYKKIGQL